MTTRFELLIFDWDGTLMDSEARITNCLRAAITDTGLPARDPRHLRDIIGLGLTEALQRLFPDTDPVTLDRLTEAYRQHFLYDDPTPSDLFPGAAALIQELYARGYQLAVATGKARRGLDRVLAETGLENYFHVTRCADEAGSKPHPQMLYDILRQLNVVPAQALMIGDTEYDLAMAANAGVAGVAACYGVHDRERLCAMAPLACVDSLDELARWLANAESPSVTPSPDKRRSSL